MEMVKHAAREADDAIRSPRMLQERHRDFAKVYDKVEGEVHELLFH